jgi:hypothetical protein
MLDGKNNDLISRAFNAVINEIRIFARYELTNAFPRSGVVRLQETGRDSPMSQE